jgi:hypothetical protein
MVKTMDHVYGSMSDHGHPRLRTIAMTRRRAAAGAPWCDGVPMVAAQATAGNLTVPSLDPQRKHNLVSAERARSTSVH